MDRHFCCFDFITISHEVKSSKNGNGQQLFYHQSSLPWTHNLPLPIVEQLGSPARRPGP